MPLKIGLIGPSFSGKLKIAEFLQNKYKLKIIIVKDLIKNALDYVKVEEVDEEDDKKKKGRAKGKK